MAGKRRTRSPAAVMTPNEVIQKKRDGGVHTDEEIAYLIRGFLAHEITDYHMSAWLMAVYINGMTPKEVLALTREMRDSGTVLDPSGLPGADAAQHRTGGVGGRT